jgi:peptidoglycan/LPS O-acetylase OafA/YrhL
LQDDAQDVRTPEKYVIRCVATILLLACALAALALAGLNVEDATYTFLDGCVVVIGIFGVVYAATKPKE